MVILVVGVVVVAVELDLCEEGKLVVVRVIVAVAVDQFVALVGVVPLMGTEGLCAMVVVEPFEANPRRWIC